MSDEISRDSRVIISFVVSVCEGVFSSVFQEFLFGDTQERSEIMPRKFLDSSETSDTSSLRDSVDKCLSLIVAVMGCHDIVSFIFFTNFLEPLFPHISRTFLDARLCFSGFSFYISTEEFDL